MRRSVTFMVECAVDCCTTRSLGIVYAFLLEDEPSAFVQAGAESFQMS